MFYSTVISNDGDVAVNEITCSDCNEVVETRTAHRHEKYCKVEVWKELAPLGQRSSVLLSQAKVEAHLSRCPAKNR